MPWTDSWKIGAAFWANARTLSETAAATQGVVAHRSRTIDAAMRNPLAADLGELGRMVPEKVKAFGDAGQAIAADWYDIQSDMLAQCADLTSLFLSGWPPKPATITRVQKRASRIALKMSATFEHALEPIHATATANHARLGRSR